jgi:predicted O-methyltransferase YrrM
MELDDYLLKYTSEEDPVLRELERETNLKVLHPRMLSGRMQGVFLQMISHMIRPVSILEIGTYTGYSAICLSKGLSPQGKLTTIERNDELYGFAKKYFEKAGILSHINQLSGDALEIIPGLQEKFDLVFIDGDKREYPDYYHAVFDRVQTGGFILIDNVLWNGKVLEGEADDFTEGVTNLNEIVRNDSRVEHVLLPLRDGLMILRKS